MPEDQSKSISSHAAKIALERSVMEAYGVTRSEARDALKQDALNKSASNLSAVLRAVPPAEAVERSVQRSEVKHEVRRFSDGVSQGTDAGSSQIAGTLSGTPTTIICLISGVYKYVDFGDTTVGADV